MTRASITNLIQEAMMIPSGNRPAESSVGSKSGAELIENPTSEMLLA